MNNQHYEEEMRKLSENQSKKYWDKMNQTITGTEMISISKEYYDSLVDDAHFLGLLEKWGVDNWAWYSFVQEEYRKSRKVSD